MYRVYTLIFIDVCLSVLVWSVDREGGEQNREKGRVESAVSAFLFSFALGTSLVQKEALSIQLL